MPTNSTFFSSRVILFASLFAFITAFGTAKARAGYDKTKWGMSLKKVKALYSGGTTHDQQNGKVNYYIVRAVAGIDAAFLNFFFSKKTGLESVFITFPQAGTKVDLKTGAFTLPTKEDGELSFKLLSESLREKYGQGTKLDNEAFVWISSDGDSIVLRKHQDDKVHTDVSLDYEKAADAIRPNADGL
ncbi:MAG: hypothetical protein ACXWSC_21540 [Bdellovibrionota bacterium]